MRNISFSLTQRQILDGSKTVTRRLGWKNVRVGERLQGIVKGQGLKKGEKVQKLRVVQVVSTRMEPLKRMTDEPEYGRAEVVKEGFPYMSPAEFVKMFCEHNKCTPRNKITRIELWYL